MRLLFPVLLLLAAGSAPAQRPVLMSIDCPSAAAHMADRPSSGRDKPPKPQSLDKLPPADSFAAVYQLDERGCMVLIKYHDARGGRR